MKYETDGREVLQRSRLKDSHEETLPMKRERWKRSNVETTLKNSHEEEDEVEEQKHHTLKYP
ncbi:hypothetical protein E2C01_082556 [Portunus trituberculatus]|uniref:Uncharacterized protein n=1 Tax=Portunus trituberculatus TaxID=210409 RepID=A0A5B7J5G2_PORTR|nr:hypothetical protein [Portunus trituberculatus]